MTDEQLHEQIYNEAHAAGMAAGLASTPIPMIVGQETFMFSNVLDRTKPVECVSDGVCGFAWVNIRPGNCQFANYLKKKRLARKDDYYGGVTVYVHEFNQSMTRKEDYARAFARVVDSYSVCTSVYSNSRMD